MKKLLVKKNNMKSLIFTAILSVIFCLSIFGFNANFAKASCSMTYAEAYTALQNGGIDISIAKSDSTHATITVINHTGCTFPMQVASFKVYDNISGSTQTQIDSSNATMLAYSTHVFTTNIASCLSQVDAWSPNPNGGNPGWPGKIFGPDGRVFTTIASAQGLFCTTPAPALAISCSATPSSVNTGGSVAWNATASGGVGSYTYSWVGTDGLSDSGSSISKSYSNVGTKVATVTVTSGSQSATANCSATVNVPSTTLTASCSATPSSAYVGDSIAWNATASGGAGGYSYSWTGTDGLSGNTQNINKSYSATGTKNSTVTVTSGTQSVTANCSATIINHGLGLFAVSCSANPTNVSSGGSINWTSTVVGGTGPFTYSWSGTDSLSGTSSATSLSYSTIGTKNATVTVTSATNTGTADCSATVSGGGGPIVCTSNCGGGGPAIYYSNSLSGYCEGVPSNGNVGDQVIWNVHPSGGNGSYSFNWYGSDGATGYGYSTLKTYSTPGPKTMTVNIYSGGESISRTCSISVGQVLAYVSPSLTSVYLSEVPYTGLSDLGNVWFFVMGLSLWSAGMAYFLQKRKGKLVTENASVVGIISNKEEKISVVVTQNEIAESAIRSVEDCARENNAIISSEAVKSIAKNCFLHNGKISIATKEVVANARKAHGVGADEWIAIGERDL